MTDLADLLKTHDIRISLIERGAPAPEPPPVIDPPTLREPIDPPEGAIREVALHQWVRGGVAMLDMENGADGPIGRQDARYFKHGFVQDPYPQAGVALELAGDFAAYGGEGAERVQTYMGDWRKLERYHIRYAMQLVTGVEAGTDWWVAGYQGKDANDQILGMNLEPTIGGGAKPWLYYKPERRVIHSNAFEPVRPGDWHVFDIRILKPERKLIVWMDGVQAVELGAAEGLSAIASYGLVNYSTAKLRPFGQPSGFVRLRFGALRLWEVAA